MRNLTNTQFELMCIIWDMGTCKVQDIRKVWKSKKLNGYLNDMIKEGFISCDESHAFLKARVWANFTEEEYAKFLKTETKGLGFWLLNQEKSYLVVEVTGKNKCIIHGKYSGIPKKDELYSMKVLKKTTLSNGDDVVYVMKED